jgi:hypothetical protein
MTDITVERGLRILQGGSRDLRESLAPDVDEDRARRALRTLRSAMDHLEDTEHFDEAHRVLDVAGRRVRVQFGCSVTFSNGQYWDDCPVSLAHSRIGMSIGGVVEEAECSICGSNPYDCPHVTGRMYDGRACVRILKRIDLDHIALVSRPAQPDARIERLSLSNRDLRIALGGDFEPGTAISCDQCLRECTGVRELLWHDHGRRF